MSYLGYQVMKLDKFGGLNTLLDATNLPVFASPDTQDTEFLPGLVRTRPGLTSLFTALSGNPTVNYLKSYITPTQIARALALDSLGFFYKENPFGTLVQAGTIENVGVYGNSVSLFGREYLAVGNGKFGTSIPRQFDDTNFDRVSQGGPGQAPSAGDESIVSTIAVGPGGASQTAAATIAAGPIGLTESSNIVTLTMAAANPVPTFAKVGDPITVAGAGVAGYNGSWTIYAILSVPGASPGKLQYLCTNINLAASGGGTVAFSESTITFTANHAFVAGESILIAGVGVAGYNGTWAVRTVLNATQIVVYVATTGLAASGGGTATAVGNIAAGVHLISVMFVTRQGYVTAPAPPAQWTATGGKRVIVSNIPIGPPNIVSRILIFTAAGGKSFFYSTGDPLIFSSNMVIGDNTTTTATVDFSDAILLSGVVADPFFELLELGECSGVTQYFSRLFWWGERNKINNFNNLTFDGGFKAVVGGGNCPLGWTPDATNFRNAGGTTVNPVIWGGGYQIVGDGVNAIVGMITQSAAFDFSGTKILFPSIAYSVRVWLSKQFTPTQGNLVVEIFSPTAGSLGTFSTPIVSAPSGSGGPGTYQEFSGALLTAQTTIPTDVLLRVYTNGTFNAAAVLIENIEIYPTARPYNTTLVRASKVEDPESYDGLTGFLDVALSNGQAVRCGYVRRNNLYFVKERSLYVTQDDGVNEPNQWTIQEVSQKVGTLSVRGVGFGDEWEIIAGIDGAYYFDGSEPQKISQEIQPTWDSINWSLGHLVDVKVDTKRKRVYFAVPLGASATANNRILTLDYTDGFGDPNPTNTVNIAGVGRKWAPWLIAANSMNFILRSDGSQQLWFGNGTGLAAATGKIYQLDPTGTIFSDDGAAINSYWQSGYFQDAGRLMFGPLVANVIGVGALSLVLRKGDQGWLTNLRSWTLPANGFRNMERMLNIETERLALRFGTNAVGANFSLQGLQLYARESVWAPLRGINA